MATPKWLTILETVGLTALQASPLAPIAPAVQAAIAEAEGIKGASGPEKLNHAVNIAVNAATVARQSGVDINPIAVQDAARSVISDTVKVVNIVSQAKSHDDDPPSMTVPKAAAAEPNTVPVDPGAPPS